MAAAATCSPGAQGTGSTAASSRSNVTSFQRRGPRAGASDSGGPRLVSIAGTRPSVRNGQLLVSTGLPALDQLLGRFGTEMGSTLGAVREGSCRGAALTPHASVTSLDLRTWRL